jgi:Transmembrane secretion effector
VIPFKESPGTPYTRFTPTAARVSIIMLDIFAGGHTCSQRDGCENTDVTRYSEARQAHPRIDGRATLLSRVFDLLHYLSVENTSTQPQSPWRPLRIPLFRNLLIANLVSDIGTFMQSVGAAWLMTSLTTSPMYVALNQTASALLFFLLALPAGFIGDIFDRRKLILRTELWMLGMAVVLAVTTITRTMTPWLLLLLTFGPCAERGSAARAGVERNRIQPGSRSRARPGGIDYRRSRRRHGE